MGDAGEEQSNSRLALVLALCLVFCPPGSPLGAAPPGLGVRRRGLVGVNLTRDAVSGSLNGRVARAWPQQRGEKRARPPIRDLT